MMSITSLLASLGVDPATFRRCISVLSVTIYRGVSEVPRVGGSQSRRLNQETKMKAHTASTTTWLPICAAIAALTGCGGSDSAITITPQNAASACAAMTSPNLAAVFPAAKTSIKATVYQAATTTIPEHCQID